MEDIDDAFEESISTKPTKVGKAKQVKDVEFKPPTNVAYMNKGKWKYDASVRNAYVWRSSKGTLHLGFDTDHKCRVLVKGKTLKRIDVADIREGFETIDKICERF